MKITILTFGSRGDVEPYLALAVGLQQAGHRVTLVAPPVYSEWIQSYGVGMYPMRFDMMELFRRPQIEALARSRKVVRLLRALREGVAAGSADSLEDAWQATEDADFVIQTGVGHGGVEIAAARGIPMAFSYLNPFAPTRAFPSFFFPLHFSLGGAYNRLTYKIVMRVMWRMYGAPLNQWRARRFGLPPWKSYPEMLNSRRAVGAPWLFGYSPNLVPKPPDWEASHHVTGYWRLQPPQEWQPPADLLHFLESGPPPVYVGFGSMNDVDPERLTREVLRALELSGQRGVIFAGGAGGLARLPAPRDVFYLDSAPHSWLFPRMAAVVHHGGAGTVGSALRAGVPSIVAPLVIDQHAWARRVERLGIGVRVITMKKLTAEILAPAIRTAVNDTALRARAAALGEMVRAEPDSISMAVEVIERYARDFAERRNIQPQ